MDKLNIDDLRRLAAIHATPAVSLTLPTHVVGEAGLQDSVALKQLVACAENCLVAQGTRLAQARELLAQAAILPS
ncbi:MAG TPA: hypothetical protein VHI72_13850, partial [Hyphomicrobiaceae bacterium]|nr:hypothetical protein [Hyphomicrobiaceae bacterium]